MTQLLLNISDEKKANKLIEFLRTLSYINVQEFNEENIILPEAEKELMRNRLQNAKEEDFKDWEEIKQKFNIK
ncbi:hypothetical protein [Brumimicrobium aurantiacum]|uniref:Uncharacterized protein n=1 Tax=Brumimicrobium aurantiacum TaxID=1737063 RepID=A0A3E1F0J7_9FLAO|nr:hypothetical protein [Brumimicrobium aurantiacum]RFC55328.1 hypothetical protein DXU93_05765 [Brumimicrobium aurantiacum]